MIADSIITDDVWATAPEDRDEAFLHIYSAARARLMAILADEEDPGPYSKELWKKQYYYELETVADTLEVGGVPSAANAVTSAAGIAEFDAAVARVITRIKTLRRDTLRTEAVSLSYHTKSSIKAALEELRAKVNKSNLAADVKAALHKKIDAVEDELSHRRSGLRPIWILAGALNLLTASVAVAADLPDAASTMQNIIKWAHEDGAAEEQQQERLRQPRIGNQSVPQIEDHTGDTRSG